MRSSLSSGVRSMACLLSVAASTGAMPGLMGPQSSSRSRSALLRLRGGEDAQPPSVAPTALSKEEITAKLNGVPVSGASRRRLKSHPAPARPRLRKRIPRESHRPVYLLGRCSASSTRREVSSRCPTRIARSPSAGARAPSTRARRLSARTFSSALGFQAGISPPDATPRPLFAPRWFVDANEARAVLKLAVENNPQLKGLHMGVHGLGNAFKLCGGWPDDTPPSNEASLEARVAQSCAHRFPQLPRRGLFTGLFGLACGLIRFPAPHGPEELGRPRGSLHLDGVL